jgi:hypothetical protein
MTAFTLNKQATAVKASVSSTRSPPKVRMLHRRLPRALIPDVTSDYSRFQSMKLPERKSPVLMGLRRHNVSRGLRTHQRAAVEGTDPEVERCLTNNAVSVRSSPKSERKDHNMDCHFNMDDARRSVSLLKFASAPQQGVDSDNDDDTDDETLSDVDTSNDSGSETQNSTKRNYTIKFQCYVKVLEIPHRESYSPKQRKRMWNASKSIRSNAKRNRIEYEWEGREWEHAPEEDEFCILDDGTKVHPAHLYLK